MQAVVRLYAFSRYDDVLRGPARRVQQIPIPGPAVHEHYR